MAVVLTHLFNHNQALVTAHKMVAAQQEASGHAVPIEASASAWKALGPDFANSVTHALSHAYTAVFVVAVALLALTTIPASFLPRKRPEPEEDPEPAEALAD
jgi:hypothetical protein